MKNFPDQRQGIKLGFYFQQKKPIAAVSIGDQNEIFNQPCHFSFNLFTCCKSSI
jgi:hypothetical protein